MADNFPLVERLRACFTANTAVSPGQDGLQRDCHEAADRIEQLERELADARNTIHEMEITVPHSTIIGLRQELADARRKALAEGMEKAAKICELTQVANPSWDKWVSGHSFAAAIRSAALPDFGILNADEDAVSRL